MNRSDWFSYLRRDIALIGPHGQYARQRLIRIASHQPVHPNPTQHARIQEDEEEARQYEAALSEVAKKVQGDIRNRSATVGSIGDSVLYRLLNFAANFEVR